MAAHGKKSLHGGYYMHLEPGECMKKNQDLFGRFAEKLYLCTRKRKITTVRWMRGLVNGLQNRVHPFESGTHLYKREVLLYG